MIRLHKIKKKSGETLVEVLASMFIFLILFGILQGAISYSHKALEKNKQIRAENAEIVQNLASVQTTTGTEKTLRFVATTPDMDQKGNEVFSIATMLNKKVVSYENEAGETKTMTFYLYGSKTDHTTDPNPADGGDTP